MRIIALFALLFATPANSEPQVSEPFQISVNVNLVVLQATVRDRSGQFVPDLKEDDFQVYEDGIRQSIKLFRHEDVPVTVGLVVDHSGSMRPRLAEVTGAARTFMQSSSPADQMFVVNFNEHVTLGLPDGMFSNRPNELAHAISYKPAEGMTALYDATIEGFSRLRAGVPEKKVLILISDGGDTASKATLPEVLKLAAQSNALVYAIGIFDGDDPDRNPKVLERIARTTGGEAYFPRELSEVTGICERIAHEIRNQYTLGYVSTNATNSTLMRTIRVTAGKLQVRTRSGYISGSPK